MTQGHDEQGSGEPRPAGPDPGDGGALRGRPSSAPPSPAPPAGGASEASTSGRSDADQVERDFEALLADAQKERDEYLDLARRTKADFENFRKRIAADLQTAIARGKVELAPGLIDAVDNLERAFEAKGIDPGTDPLEPESGSTPDGFDHGVLLVLNGMRETLRRQGIEVVDPKGEKFDPNRHEALSTVAVEGTEPGTVVEVLQKGYRFGDQLVRPARVVVSE